MNISEQITAITGAAPWVETYFQRFPKRDMRIAKVNMPDGSQSCFVDHTDEAALAELLASLVPAVLDCGGDLALGNGCGRCTFCQAQGRLAS